MLRIASTVLADAWTDAGLLSVAEHARATAIAKPQRRRQFIAGRMLLRRMLADIVGGRAEDVEIDATAGAAPRVSTHPDLHLSVSHSGDWVVAAVADRPVGIDIERLGERRDPQRFARWVCSADEWTDWRTLDGAAADDALIAHWTRKEAWLKREGGEVLLTRMHRLHAGTADAASADGATWRVADAAMLSVCADAVADLRIDAKTLQLLRPPAHWRMTASAA